MRRPTPSRVLLTVIVVVALAVTGTAAFLVMSGSTPPASGSPGSSPSGRVAGATLLPSGTAGPTSKNATTASAGSVCSDSQVTNASIKVCLSGATPGATVSGPIAISTKATTGGQGAGIQRAVYQLDGSPLLTAFASPYKFDLDTARWPDGNHRLSVVLLTRDGVTTAPASMSLTFKNGTTAAAPGPASGQPFRPTPGRGASGPFVVAAVGDGASGEKGETETVARIASWNPNLFLYLGDVYENGRPAEFDNWYGGSSSQDLYGRFRPITDPTVGNHEYIGTDAPGYFGYWQGIGHYYSFDAGGWHFVSIDSNMQYAGLQPGTAQYDWLEHDLSTNTAACTVVYYHHPLFNVGPEKAATQMTAVWALLAQHHVTLVLNGHDHDYQRWNALDGSGQPSPTGVTEFIVGSGGHGHQPQQSQDPRVAASDFHDFGALKLTLAPASAQFEFVTSSGSAADSGTLNCQGTRADLPALASSTGPLSFPGLVPEAAPSDAAEEVRIASVATAG